MKLAGFLALALAIVLGIWTVVDYVQNERDKSLIVQELQHEIRSGGHAGSDDTRENDEAERRDGMIGIVAACALIGSVILFSQSKKG